MAWTTPLTGVANTALTAAQWNASVRDNLLMTAPALATAGNQLWVSTGANAGAIRTPGTATVATDESFTPTALTFGDLPTVGPSVTATTGTKAIVMFGAFLGCNVGTGSGIMGFDVSGSTTIGASVAHSVRSLSSANNQRYRMFSASMPTLTAGSNTFTAKYTTGSGSNCLAADRTIIVFPL